MILVGVGNHNQSFERLIKRIDEIAPEIKEKIIIQRGHTNYVPKNCESFIFSEKWDFYVKKCRLMIIHGGIGNTLDAVKTNKKPVIIVPRQYKYNEHINDHQVDFCKVMEKKHGAKIILNISDLTPELLKSYKKVISLKSQEESFNRLQNFLKKTIEESD